MRQTRRLIIACTLAAILITVFAISGLRMAPNDAVANRVKEIKQILQRSGGLSHVNREAEALLNLFGTNEMRSVTGQDLLALPSISRLGNMVRITPSTPNIPANITVRYGSHDDTRFLYIFDPRAALSIKRGAQFVQVEGNVFAEVP
jgi:hypothetical protein